MTCGLAEALAILVVAAPGCTFGVASGPAGFVIDPVDGHLTGAGRDEQALIGDSLDEYWLDAEDGTPLVRATEADDRVTEVTRDEGTFTLRCTNEKLGLTLTKRYAPGSIPGSLRKMVTVPAFGRRAQLQVFSRVRLADAYAPMAELYTPRQSWGGDPLLFGVRKLTEVKAPLTCGSGWDNRFVVAFRPERDLAVAHWRSLVDGAWVPYGGIITTWAAKSSAALTYLPDGWRWRLLHTLGSAEARAAADYVLLRGDWYEAWAAYRSLPEFRATYAHLDRMPAWPQQVKYGTFWSPPHYEASAKAAAQLADRLGGDAYLSIGIFGWSLDGDYETERPFLTETLSMALTPDYLAKAVAALQEHPRTKVGLYIQGGLIDSETRCYREHPDWVIRDPEGKPVDSGFADNPVGRMYLANPREEAWVTHQLSRVRAVCNRYDCGFIYLDGGGFQESVDWPTQEHQTFTDCRSLNERFFEAVRSTGPERALLCNFQNAPFADLSWLECGYFNDDIPWQVTVDFCFDTECQSDSRYTLEPLYWRDNDRYLAMCVGFGFTPCGGLSAEMPEATWRAIEAAWKMKPGNLILNSAATSPVWWRDGVPVVTFAERVGDQVVVPILNFGMEDTLEVDVDLEVVGLRQIAGATVYRPLQAPETTTVQAEAAQDGTARFRLNVPTGWRGITLLTLK